MPAPVRMALRWTIPVWQTKPMTDAVQRIMLAARNERGCLACSMATQASERVTLLYQEDWDTEENLRRQVRSQHFVALVGLVESAIEPPCIEFTLPTGTRGLDYAEEVRRETKGR